MLEGLTKLERERKLRRLRGEQEELIEAMGQESDEKAAPIVIEQVKQENKKEEEKQMLDLEYLKILARNKVMYNRYLIAILQRFIREEYIPSTYKLSVESSKEGIVLSIDGTDYQGAFRVCGIPKYDVNACKILAVRLGNTVARMDGNFRETESGLLLATPHELEVATHNGRTRKSSS